MISIGLPPNKCLIYVAARLRALDYSAFIKMVCLYHFIHRCSMPKIEFYSFSIHLKPHSLLGFLLNCSMREYLGNQVTGCPFGLEFSLKQTQPRTV